MFRSSVIYLLMMLVGIIKAQDNKIALDDSNILLASREWMANPEEAEVKYGHISRWDTSNVTNMAWLFVNGSYEGGSFSADGESTFNDDISNWDTSNVKDMSAMFYYCTQFDQDLSHWDVSKVKYLSSTFEQAKNFKGTGLENWKTMSLQSLDSTFQAAHLFEGDLSLWNTSSVTSMTGTFSYTRSFNADISNWDVSNVEQMVQTFQGAKVFNVDINPWNVYKVDRLINTFYKARKFDQTLCWNLNPDIYLVDTFCGSKASFDPECVSHEQRKAVSRCHRPWGGKLRCVVKFFLALLVLAIGVKWYYHGKGKKESSAEVAFDEDHKAETETVQSEPEDAAKHVAQGFESSDEEDLKDVTTW